MEGYAVYFSHISAHMFAGFTSEVLNALSVTDLECVIKVYIALAKCLANIHKASESVAAYQNALRVSFPHP